MTAERLDAAMAQIRVELSEVRTDVARLESLMNERLRQQTTWLVATLFGAMSTGMAVAAAVASALG